MTAGVGRAAAFLSMDDKFAKTQASQSQEDPEHLVGGLAAGLTSFGKGLFQGVSGIVTDPIKGAKQGGGLGFLKGVRPFFSFPFFFIF